MFSLVRQALSAKLTDHFARSTIRSIQRSAGHPSDAQLLDQIKQLNHRKQYAKAIDLFNQYHARNSKGMASMIIAQALKACTQLQDRRRATQLHRIIAPYVDKDPYVLSASISLYSECV